MNFTPKQLRFMKIIRDSRISRGFSPTMQELAAEMGISRVTVFEHVEALIEKGALTRVPNKARSLSIAEHVVFPDEERSLTFPLVGRIAAGMPIEQCANDDELDIESILGPRVGQKGRTFALRVKGDSMRDEGILDGDYVLVEERSTARNGERVVALLPDGESTLKTFFREKDGSIRLQPANPEFEPVIVKECQIQGVVTGVLRNYV